MHCFGQNSILHFERKGGQFPHWAIKKASFKPRRLPTLEVNKLKSGKNLLVIINCKKIMKIVDYEYNSLWIDMRS